MKRYQYLSIMTLLFLIAGSTSDIKSMQFVWSLMAIVGGIGTLFAGHDAEDG